MFESFKAKLKYYYLSYKYQSWEARLRESKTDMIDYPNRLFDLELFEELYKLINSIDPKTDNTTYNNYQEEHLIFSNKAEFINILENLRAYIKHINSEQSSRSSFRGKTFINTRVSMSKLLTTNNDQYKVKALDTICYFAEQIKIYIDQNDKFYRKHFDISERTHRDYNSLVNHTMLLIRNHLRFYLNL